MTFFPRSPINVIYYCLFDYGSKRSPYSSLFCLFIHMVREKFLSYFAFVQFDFPEDKKNNNHWR